MISHSIATGFANNFANGDLSDSSQSAATHIPGIYSL